MYEGLAKLWFPENMDEQIAKNLEAPEEGIRLQATVASWVKEDFPDDYQGYSAFIRHLPAHYRNPRGGREVDIVLKFAFVEVTITAQTRDTRRVFQLKRRWLNPDKREVIFYAPNYREDQVQRLWRHSKIIVVRDRESLRAAIQNIKNQR